MDFTEGFDPAVGRKNGFGAHRRIAVIHGGVLRSGNAESVVVAVRDIAIIG